MELTEENRSLVNSQELEKNSITNLNELKNQIISNWVQFIANKSGNDLKQKLLTEDSKEEIEKRIIYKFVEIASELVPSKNIRPEEILQRFIVKRGTQKAAGQKSQIISFLHSELDKL